MTHPSIPSRLFDSSDATTSVAIRYRPIAEIGSGGMGSVALAQALSGPHAGAFVAIKRLYPALAREAEIVNAFLDEVWLISALHHPNIVESFDWGTDHEGGYLAMEFVPGDSLRALVRARELAQAQLPVPAAVEIIAAAAEGLHAAHELRSDTGAPLDVVHRDVSPANVLIGYDGTVKLIDFGVAKAAGKLVHTQMGLIKGKYGYMSPEQMRGEALDRRSDVFSLGILAWEVLTLCRLYNAASEFEIFRMISEETPVAPSELRHDVPHELDRIVLRCLSKHRDARFASCAEVAQALAPLREPTPAARARLAQLARESMPERLQWIEQVTGAAVPVPQGPVPDEVDTDRDEDLRPLVNAAAPRGPGAPQGSGARTPASAAVPQAPAPAPLAAPVPTAAPTSSPGRAAALPFALRPDQLRYVLLVGGLAMVAILASLVGVWLGRH